MKKVTLVEFEQLFVPISQFLEESEKIDSALEIIFPSSFVFSEKGEKLLDYYIDLIERYLEMESDTISWFVFENSMGKNSYTINDVEIDSIEKLYGVLYNEE